MSTAERIASCKERLRKFEEMLLGSPDPESQRLLLNQIKNHEGMLKAWRKANA